MTIISLELIPKLLMEGKLIAKNYRGELIPIGYGIIFPLIMIITFVLATVFRYYPIEESYYLISLVLTMAFLGFLDDVLGNKDKQGFKGHFSALLFKRELTTGAIKAIFSFFLVFFISFKESGSLFWVSFDTILILLMSNFVNLLDLRPGRALKATLIFLILILIFSSKIYYLVIPIIMMVIFSSGYDLSAKGMMGDVGANVLGVLIGGLIIISGSLLFKIIVLIFLFWIHIYAERYSISKLIRKNDILLYVDQLGRK